MSRTSKDYGRSAEGLAAHWLEKKGYRILERNLRIGKGELDFIAEDGDTLVFVEVKARRSDELGGTSYAVDGRKRQQLTKLALAYLAQRGFADRPCRFDVILINGSEEKLSQITHLKDAFEVSSSAWQW